MRRRTFCLILACHLAGAGRCVPEAPDPSQGAWATRVRRRYMGLQPADVVARAYEEAWRRWGLAERPADFPQAFRRRYGLHRPRRKRRAADGVPRRGLLAGLGNDCLLCHAGTIAGQTIIGLGNASLDMQSFYEELFAADGSAWGRRCRWATSGTIEARVRAST